MWEELFKVIPPDFREGGSCYGAGKGGEVLTATYSCIKSSIWFYTDKLLILTSIVSFVFIAYSGYMMFTAFGDELKYAQAKKTLLYAIIGLVISIFAIVIVKLFASLLGTTSFLTR